MAQKVTAMDIKMAAAMAGGVGNVSQFCRVHGISRQTFYKYQRRFAVEGVEGLLERSRRPSVSPSVTPSGVEELLVRVRKELADDGRDAGPQSVLWELMSRGQGLGLPSRATVARVFTRRGQVEPAPRKRPRSSYLRFVADRPNERWQQDWTLWKPSHVGFAVAGVIDDHSRLIVGLRAALGDATLSLTWQAFLDGVERVGVPQTSLTDNGSVYANARNRGGPSVFQENLRALGVHPLTSRPRHPQTCGKIERFWQTLKKWLDTRPDPATVELLQTQLDDFRVFYNNHRGHRALAGATPAATFTATNVARPPQRPLPTPVHLYRQNVNRYGTITIGSISIGLGARHTGTPVTAVLDGDHIAIYAGPQLLRELTIDRTRSYQPQPH